MKILSLNHYGLGNSQAVRDIHCFVKELDPQIDDVENSSPMGHTVLATQNRTCTAKTIERKTFREHRCGAGLTLSEGQVRIRPFPF